MCFLVLSNENAVLMNAHKSWPLNTNPTENGARITRGQDILGQTYSIRSLPQLLKAQSGHKTLQPPQDTGATEGTPPLQTPSLGPEKACHGREHIPNTELRVETSRSRTRNSQAVPAEAGDPSATSEPQPSLPATNSDD